MNTRPLLFASLVLAAAVLTSAAGDSLAQSFPTKPIRLIVPAPPGGGTDAVARIIGQKLSESLGQPVMIENRGGANGIIAGEMVAKAAPDGYTLFMIYSGILTISPSLFKLPYDPVKDFAPVATFVKVPNILMVHPSVPAKSVSELIALAKSQPGRLNYAIPSLGGSNHLAVELFRVMTGINVVGIPYRGSDAMTALIAGQVQIMFYDLVISASQIKAGRVRALAVTTSERIPTMPDLPTVAESGVPGYEVTPWYGMVAPAGTPTAIITKLNSEFSKIQKMSDVKERLSPMGAVNMEYTPEQMAAYIKVETDNWAKLIKEAGIKAE